MRRSPIGTTNLGFLLILALAAIPALAIAASADSELQAEPTPGLVAAAERSARLFSDLLAERKPLLADARALETELDRLAVTRESNALPPRPEMDAPPADLATANAMADQWARRTEAADTLARVGAERLAALERFHALALRLAGASAALARTARDLVPLLDALEARASAGEIEPAEREAIRGPLPESIDPAAFEAAAADWRRQGRLAEADIERTEAHLAEVEAAVAGDAPLKIRARRWHRAATSQARLESTLAERPTGELLADFNARLAAFELADRALSQRISDAEALARAVREAEQALDDLSPPPPAAPGDTGGAGDLLARLATAREALALAESVVAYRVAQRQALTELHDARVAAAEAAANLAPDIGPVLDQGLALQSLARLLRERLDADALPAAAAPGAFEAQIDRLFRADAGFAERTETDDARIATLEETLRSNRAALRAARAQAAQYRADLAREEAWTADVEELAGLDDAALIAAFEAADQRYQDDRSQLREIEREAARYLEAAERVGATMAGRVNPVSVSGRRQDQAQGFSDWLRSQGLQPVEQPAAADGGAPEVAPETVDGDSDPAAGGTTEATAITDSWLTAIRELRDSIVVRRRTFLQDGQALRAEFQAELKRAAEALAGLRSRYQDIWDDARRAWAAAGILQARAARGEIAAADLPERVADWRDRSGLSRVSAVAATITQAEAAVDARLTALQELGGADSLIPPLQAWQESLSDEARKLSRYIELRQQYDAIGDPDQMDALEAQKLEAEVRRRVNADYGAYADLADYFTNAEVETLDELLERLYRRLVISEGQIANLEDRQTILAQVMAAAEASRETLRELRDEVAKAAAAAEDDLTIATALVRAALDPAAARRVLAEASEATGVELDAADVPALPQGGDEAAQRSARHDLIRSLRPDWALASGYAHWLADLEARIEPLGTIDSEIAAFQDLDARLEARRNELTETIDRLVGYDPEELEALARDEALDTQQRQQLARGEIGNLKSERESLLASNAMRSAIALAILPLIAILVIVVARLFGRSAIHQVQKRKASEPGAVERAETLNSIFQTIVTFMAIALAVIYMLEAVNVDVAPLIASLGIFGVAIAFGAQSTIKDLFGGFFLLLEKRLNVGDWVAVNSSYGVVESIGLRLTTVRGWADGGLTYIRNGEIASVTNYNRGSKANSFARGQKRNSFTGHIMVKVYTTNEADPEAVVAIMRRTAAELRADPEYANEIYDIWVEPGVNDILADNNSFEFRALLIGTGMIWAAGRVFRNKAVAYLREAGIALPQTHVRISGAPSMQLDEQPGD